MANICTFDLRAWGDNDALMELYDLLDNNGKYKGDGVGRVYQFAWSELKDNFGDGFGNCAWSVETIMSETKQHPLENELKRLKLTVEIYSREADLGFEEHFIYYKGQKIVDEYADNYEEFLIEEYNEQELKELAARFGMSLAELYRNSDDGYFLHGGFNARNWSTFEEIKQMAGALGITA